MTIKISTQVDFIPSYGESIFTLYSRPYNSPSLEHQVLIVPPFAEEMNKSRRMFSLLRTSLAENGIASLLVDLFGTGDSPGDFSETSWQQWLQNLDSAIQWLQTQGAKKISIVTLRAGALLALDFINQSNFPLHKTVLWQPITNGQVMMGQFLRLRLAAGLFGGPQAKESSKDLIQKLKAGESLEIAGYELSADLYQTINELRLQNLISDRPFPILWLEIVQNEDQQISVGSKKVIEAWKLKDFQILDKTIVGEPFWSLAEINVVPQLIKETTSYLDRK